MRIAPSACIFCKTRNCIDCNKQAGGADDLIGMVFYFLIKVAWCAPVNRGAWLRCSNVWG